MDILLQDSCHLSILTKSLRSNLLGLLIGIFLAIVARARKVV